MLSLDRYVIRYIPYKHTSRALFTPIRRDMLAIEGEAPACLLSAQPKVPYRALQKAALRGGCAQAPGPVGRRPAPSPRCRARLPGCFCTSPAPCNRASSGKRFPWARRENFSTPAHWSGARERTGIPSPDVTGPVSRSAAPPPPQ